MLREADIVHALVIDLVLGGIWHFVTFIMCISFDTGFFDPSKRMYQPHKWERNGKFYSDVLKINRWKKYLPGYTGRNGFSKNHLEDISPEYLDRFIMETCRAEWNHISNCLFAVVLFALNQLAAALCLTIVLLLLNLPFVMIQRYNRFRLQRLRRMVERKTA